MKLQILSDLHLENEYFMRSFIDVIFEEGN